jgi:lipopolysaccharide export system permease protein
VLKTIDFYIIRKFLGTFFYAISLLIIIVIIFDISENIDEFIEKGAPLNAIIFDYYLNFIPYFVNLFSYLFTFISVIYFTSKMASNTEIISILSSGISYYRMLRPYFISAIILALLSFYLTNFLIPVTNQKRRVFKNQYIENIIKEKDQNIHYQISPGTFVYVESFNMRNMSGFRFTMERFNRNELVYKLSADRITWDSIGQKWMLENYIVREIHGKEELIYKGSNMDTLINLKPADLYVRKEVFEEMNFTVLRQYIESEKLKGSEEVMIYEVEKHTRISSPFATLVLTLIGVSLSSRKIRGGIGMHLGLGILITFAFILFMRISTVFALYGNLSPALAAWIPNIIFSLIGLGLLRAVPK